MKYKVGDLVRIKSKTWWRKNNPSGFPREMAEECCGKVGKIIGYRSIHYYETDFGHDWWDFHRDWIKEKVEKINVTLWQMKDEI